MAVEPTPGPGEDAVSGRLDAPAHVLLSVPHLDEREDRLCADLLTAADPADERVLVVTVTDTHGDAHRRWDREVGVRPAEFAVVSVEFLEDGPAPAARDAPAWVSRHAVGDPGDLTGLGVEVSGRLASWAAEDEQVVVCLRSLTTMLQYVEIEELVRFLQELVAHLDVAGAVSHFHLDPTAVDDGTERTLRHVFDAAVAVEGEAVDVRTLG